MFDIGDLVKIVATSYYIDGIDDREWFDKTEIRKIGLITAKDENSEAALYLVIVAEEDGKIEEYLYYEYELEKVG